MGTIFLAASSTTTKKGGSSELILLGIIFVIMIVFMFRSSRRRQSQAQQTQRQVVDGARVRTSFGLYGRIVDSDDRNVMLEVAPGVQLKMARQAVTTVVPDDEPDGLQKFDPDTDMTAGDPDLTEPAGADLGEPAEATESGPADTSEHTDKVS